MYPEFPDTEQGRADQRAFDKSARATIRSVQGPDYRKRADNINREEQGEPDVQFNEAVSRQDV